MRRAFAVGALAAALAIAAGAFVSTAVRLAAGPAGVPASSAGRASAHGADESLDAVLLRGLDDRRAGSMRLIGTPEGLVAVGWRSESGMVCMGVYRSGPQVPFPAIACVTRAEFAADGVSLRWPDSPDLGPFDIAWTPGGELALTSARPLRERPTPRPSD